MTRNHTTPTPRSWLYCTLFTISLTFHSCEASTSPIVYVGIGGGAIGLILLVLDLICIFEVLNSSESLLSKLLLILLILLFPLGGLFVYCFCFKRKIRRQSLYHEV
eukprot:TRINITY_DN9856_c0_g1_i1.p1 TRINITY_DN9856_c0_g1~~TRINITY_DN9856_c0_g1_i1.p1  ORF type:complete len:106 (+),score=3.69 TRINITY_DN9856_c0_g1_i1:3-320(+)